MQDLISGKGWLILLAIPYFPFVPKSQRTTESRHPWNDQINNLQPLNSPKFWTRPFKRVASSGLSHFRTPPCILGCSIPNTKMEFGRGWSRTGCRLTPLVSIQNPDPEKFQEVRERGLASFSVLKRKEKVPDMGESKSSWTLVFFPHHFPPCMGLCFFQNTKTCKSSLTHFLKFFRIRVLDTH